MKKLLILITILATLGGCDNGMSGGVQQKTLTSENAIREYEWFKAMEGEIRRAYKDEEVARSSYEDLLNSLGRDRSTWSKEDKNELSYKKQIWDGCRMNVNALTEEYNAKSSMANKSIFKNNLPTNIIRGTGTALEFKYGNLVGGN